MKSCKSMKEVREEIDRLDRAIVPLLVERVGYIEQAAHIKQTRDAVRDEARIDDVLAKTRASAEAAGGHTDMVETIYRTLVEWSIAHEFDVFDALARRQDATA